MTGIFDNWIVAQTLIITMRMLFTKMSLFALHRVFKRLYLLCRNTEKLKNIRSFIISLINHEFKLFKDPVA